MDIIKETAGSQYCVIRTTTYAHTLAHFETLATIAMADFPALTKENITIAHFAGDRYKGTFGIEFNLRDIGLTSVPSDYADIACAELLLG